MSNLLAHLLLILALIQGTISFGQIALDQAEMELEKKLNALRASKTDEERKVKNAELKDVLEKTFKIDGFFEYPFEKLSTMGTITSPDQAFRLFNWNIENEDQSFTYFCYVAYKYNKEIVVTELKDNSFMLPARPEETLDHENWYGALYYQIIPVSRGTKQLYTVLGWDGGTSFSDIKVIDILYFSGSKPKLGYSAIKEEEGRYKRKFFEFKNNAVMTMRYEKDRKMIIYDHLSPETPNLVGVYAYYIPDMSYDAYEWDGKYWVHKSDVIALNQKDARKKTVIKDKNGKTISVIENEWIDPSDVSAPVDNGQHVAVTPEDQENAANKSSKKDEKKKDIGSVHPKSKKRKKDRPGSAIGATKKKRKG